MKFFLAVLMMCPLITMAATGTKDFTGFTELKNGHKLFTEYTAPKKNQPTLVFVNGLTFSTKDYFLVSQVLIQNGYGVLLYDAYGMGQTLLNNSFPENPIKVDSQVNELDELMAKIGLIAPYNLVGLSYGGGVLTAYATKFPTNVKTLMLMSPYTEVIEESKQLILKQIAQSRLMFPLNKATDEELANYFIRQFAYQTYPIFEPSVLENPFKLEGVVKLVQGITPYRPIDDAVKLPAGTVHMMIGSQDEYVKKPVYDGFWKVVAPAAKCSYVSVLESKHKITTIYPYFAARWINFVMQSKGAACTGLEYTADPLLLEMNSSAGSFNLPDFK
ncbi:MAG: alpha/beta hydrolase [Pseudobdellovibrio sp.]